MREIKTAVLDNELMLQAEMEDGQVAKLNITIGSDSALVSKEDFTKLVEWLSGLNSKVIPVREQKKVLDTPHDELSQRKVINPTFSGVQVFDNSDKLSKANTVKFTIPNKS